MSAGDSDAERSERARAVGVFRYQVISEALDPALTARQRGELVRQLADMEHPGPFGTGVRISRTTIDRWLHAWRIGGFDALVPPPRRVQPRTPQEILKLAVSLKTERPERTAAQVARILRLAHGWSPSDRTLQRHFERMPPAPPRPGQVFGRFQAAAPNEMWVGDALHGPRVAGRKTYLFCFLDDHSRAVVGHRFGFAEDTVRLAAALRPALAARGVPGAVYVDNGSAFVDAWLLRACAVLGIRLIHSTPNRPEGKGKIERFNRTVRDQFLVEYDDDKAADLATLNRWFTAWVEQVYHRQVHSQTGVAPLERWLAGAPFKTPAPGLLAEAFRWSQKRVVSKVGTVKLHSNVYEVDHVLAGRSVELIFDPFDLAAIEVRCAGTSFGAAIPQVIGRHSHPKARPETEPAAPAATGIDYIRLVDAAHDRELGQRINYAALAAQHDEHDGELR
jgi:putative transposase